jgi:YggT family protein
VQNAFTFIISSLLNMYVITFFLRLVLASARADFRNPLAQFIVKVTNPLVIPARRIIPAVGGLDTATLVILLVVQTIATAILVKLSCVGEAQISQIVLFGLVRLVHLILTTYFWLIIVYVVSSWVSPGGYNPALAMLGAVVEPVLAPFRRLIPTIGGLDLSPVFVFLALGFLERLIPGASQVTGLVCLRF